MAYTEIAHTTRSIGPYFAYAKVFNIKTWETIRPTQFIPTGEHGLLVWRLEPGKYWVSCQNIQLYKGGVHLCKNYILDVSDDGMARESEPGDWPPASVILTCECFNKGAKGD